MSRVFFDVVGPYQLFKRNTVLVFYICSVAHMLPQKLIGMSCGGGHLATGTQLATYLYHKPRWPTMGAYLARKRVYCKKGK